MRQRLVVAFRIDDAELVGMFGQTLDQCLGRGRFATAGRPGNENVGAVGGQAHFGAAFAHAQEKMVPAEAAFQVAQVGLDQQVDQLDDAGAVRDWGFWPGKPAFTHTIAYTLEGFLESAILFGEKDILEKTVASGEQFLKIRQQTGRTAGRGWAA